MPRAFLLTNRRYVSHHPAVTPVFADKFTEPLYAVAGPEIPSFPQMSIQSSSDDGDSDSNCSLPGDTRPDVSPRQHYCNPDCNDDRSSFLFFLVSQGALMAETTASFFDSTGSTAFPSLQAGTPREKVIAGGEMLVPGRPMEAPRFDVIVKTTDDESMPDPHICTDCGKRYSTSSNLARHRQTHRSPHDQKARQCPHCEKVYVSMPAFSMHVRTHSQGCACPYCGKRFSRPWLLQGHVRTHTGEKPFSCLKCGKSFADKSNLRAHIQTHSTHKPYICGRCGKAFALKSYLYKHEEASCMRRNSFRSEAYSPHVQHDDIHFSGII